MVAPGRRPDAYERGGVHVDSRAGGRAAEPRDRAAAVANGRRCGFCGALDVDLIHGHSLLACALAATDDKRPDSEARDRTREHAPGRARPLTRPANDAAHPARHRSRHEGRHPSDSGRRRPSGLAAQRPGARRPVRPHSEHRRTELLRAPSGRRRAAGALLRRRASCEGLGHSRGGVAAVAKAVPEATLEVLGWDDDAATASFGGAPERIQVTGHADLGQVGSAMSRASVVVLPSRFEIAPVTLAEAWASGSPVVATAVGGVASLGRGAAVLVPSESPPELARALIGVLGGHTDVAACKSPKAVGARKRSAPTPSRRRTSTSTKSCSQLDSDPSALPGARR